MTSLREDQLLLRCHQLPQRRKDDLFVIRLLCNNSYVLPGKCGNLLA